MIKKGQPSIQAAKSPKDGAESRTANPRLWTEGLKRKIGKRAREQRGKNLGCTQTLTDIGLMPPEVEEDGEEILTAAGCFLRTPGRFDRFGGVGEEGILSDLSKQEEQNEEEGWKGGNCLVYWSRSLSISTLLRSLSFVRCVRFCYRSQCFALPCVSRSGCCVLLRLGKTYESVVAMMMLGFGTTNLARRLVMASRTSQSCFRCAVWVGPVYTYRTFRMDRTKPQCHMFGFDNWYDLKYSNHYNYI